MQDYLFTSESVADGHPDKICDQISDTILDLYLNIDPQARVAVETLATTNKIILAGEVRGPASITPARLADTVRQLVKNIGYEQPGFNWKSLDIQVLIHAQSPDIARGVDAGPAKDEGAGDQGIMFGYACQETPELLPAPLYYAHAIMRSLGQVRRKPSGSLLGPDGKSQVTIKYENGRPVKAERIVVSVQHHPKARPEDIRALVKQHVTAILPEGWMCPDKFLFVNPTGRFVIGGPDGDTGLTGRKIIVDTYGGAAPHGGGAFSGKDPTKVDRSAAYAMRYLAKNIVAAGLAERCTLQVSYAIGLAQPLSLYVDTHGTGRVDEEKLLRILPQIMDLTPRGIRQRLELNRPIYARTATYGHFGRAPDVDGGFSWEKLDLVDELRRAF